MENLRQLHIIRGLAALYVAIANSKVVFWSGGKEYINNFPTAHWNIGDYIIFGIDMFTSAAQEFVIVFFVLSGFFIAYSFEKNKWTIKKFFLNRLTRIYPPYLFSVILSVLVFLFIQHYNNFLFNNELTRATNVRIINSYNELNIATALKALLFLPSNDYIAGNLSYWSLLPEWLFYMLIPFLISKKRVGLFIFTCLFIVGLVVNYNKNLEFYNFVMEYGMYFFTGVYFFDFIYFYNWKKHMPNIYVSYIASITLLLLTIGLGVAEINPLSRIAACLLTLAAIMTLLAYPISNKFMFKFGTFLGDISYTLYLCHLPIFYFMYALVNKITGEYFFYERIYWFFIPIALLASYGFYTLVEKRTLVLISKIK